MSTRSKAMLMVVVLLLAVISVGMWRADWFFGDDDMTNMRLSEATTYQSGPFRVSVDINPAAPTVGDNHFAVMLTDASSNPVTGASIKAFGEMTAMATMPMMRALADLEEVKPGLYAGPLHLEMSGEWPLSLSIQKQGMGQARLGFDMATGRDGLRLNSGGKPLAKTINISSDATQNKPMHSDVMGRAVMQEPNIQQDGMMATIETPQANIQGFYVMGNFEVKVEVVSGSLAMGDNEILVIVCNLDGQRVADADIRAVAQLLDESGQPQGHTPVIHFADEGEGRYRGTLTLDDDGEYTLAVDVATEKPLGHGDLILTFNTKQTDNSMSGLQAATATPRGIAYYSCSMHTSVREAGPGQCPICSMDLVAVTNEQIQSGVITVDARRRQLIGVEIGMVVRKNLDKTIRAVGRVDYDERSLSNVTLKFDAWVGDLKVDYVGKSVKRGQQLFSVYSPELLSAQQEYLETLRRLSHRGPGDSLVKAARKRLMLWNISPEQIKALEQRGEPLEYLPIYASNSGTVVEKMINEGSHMNTGDTLLQIANLSKVWIDAEVYEADLPLISEGMSAMITLPYVTNAQFQTKVDYIYPYLDRVTRTARVRLVLDNLDGQLKPDMYAEVVFQVNLGERLMVPEEAVLIAGESRVVFKDMGEGGKLKPVRVKTGQRVNGWIEITEGLEVDDRVITSGNFLIAAEAKLKTGVEQW